MQLCAQIDRLGVRRDEFSSGGAAAFDTHERILSAVGNA
jgi:hypothetical protein